MILIRNQHGVAALLTTVFVAVFISVLTIGLADVLNTEQSQTLGIHNSNRAQQAAQAGVEDALARIKYWANTGTPCIYQESDNTPQQCAPAVRVGNNNNNCPSTGGSGGSVWRFTENSGNACWIHRSVTSKANDLTGSLVADKDVASYTKASTAQINLGGTTKALVVNWGSRTPIVNCNLSQNPWPNGTDGALELTVVSYDNSGNIANPIKGVLMPKVTLGVPCGSASYYSDLGSVSQCPSQYDQSNGASPTYKFCTQITLPPSTTTTYPNAYLRLRARFSGDTYSITALTSTGGSQASLPNNSLTIDVTGQAGSVYRRIIAQSTITNPQIYSIFDFVLFSEDDLNKSYACVNATAGATCQ